MKILNLSAVFMICLSLFFLMASCNNDNNNPNDTTQTVIENNIETGSWRIILFNDSGNDETNHFAGYNFTFGSNGTLTASNGSTLNTGSWNVTDSNSNDDSKDDLDFNVQFSSPDNFEDLSEDWSIISQSSDKIELTHVSGGNGGVDFLTFEKN